MLKSKDQMLSVFKEFHARAERFNMHNAKPVASALPADCKLNASQCLKTEKDKVEMRRVPYALVVGSVMYAMLDIAFFVGISAATRVILERSIAQS